MVPIPSFFLFAYFAGRSDAAFYIFHHVVSKHKKLIRVFFLSIITSSKIYRNLNYLRNDLENFCFSKKLFLG